MKGTLIQARFNGRRFFIQEQGSGGTPPITELDLGVRPSYLSHLRIKPGVNMHKARAEKIAAIVAIEKQIAGVDSRGGYERNTRDLTELTIDGLNRRLEIRAEVLRIIKLDPKTTLVATRWDGPFDPVADREDMLERWRNNKF